ncbi:MAG: isoaspartyl peptidase/L-asparaginase [Bacteroidetes bacterium]|nr:MAG: isoaspartyl peptidase/L-asparaginase [Bacteroidota bacterium]
MAISIHRSFLLFLAGASLLLLLSACGAQPARPDYVLVIHGGAGTILPDRITPEQAEAYHAALAAALATGEAVLAEGGSALDAVEATLRLLEDDSLFNAGRGAVLTAEGRAELDASFMDGRDRQAGAVAGVTNLRHPIRAARMVMEKSPHVMMAGRGAEVFAIEAGLDTVPNAYFVTARRRQQWRRSQPDSSGQKHGTVGCLALDRAGNLAAGTSTGGMSNKRYGRVGDSPIIGAGTYADNATCAVSCTGHGEYFIRHVVAYNVAARMAYAGQSLTEAAEAVIHQELVAAGGDGGLIALDRQGNIAMPFNTPGMYRGYVRAGEPAFTALFGEE